MTLIKKLTQTGLATLGLVAAVSAHADLAADLKGTWTGTWDITQWYNGSTPIEGEPFSAAVTLVIGTGPGSGTLHVDLPAEFGPDDAVDYTGVVTGIGTGPDGTGIRLEVSYPELFADGVGALLLGSRLGNVLSGTYTELNIPIENYLHWSGPITLTTPVPEPAGLVLAAAGLGGLCWRQRRSG
ncbi:MAG: PEP-CTERM sorting domain-containing protein [Aquabacterium sp.]|uniref:PEP-CTERM sorting domain-containing protein n=1 Tax=Aquabacterium sp. TaxID=1872578 RepID=UPI0025FE872F|nr:PEP-CTERM sorting domain-containing protein [uncultured Aquabacterium sp.]